MTLTPMGRAGSLLKLSLLGCAVSLTFTTSSQAAVGCGPTSGQATFTYREATVQGFSCQVTDKLLGQFSANAQGIDLDSVFTFSQQGNNQHLLTLNQVSGIRVPGGLSYTIQVTDPNFRIYAGQTQGFVPQGVNLTSSVSVFMDGMTPSTVTSVGGNQSPLGVFGSQGSSFFTNDVSWVPTSAVGGPDYLVGFNIKYGQGAYPPGTPGPLPLLGAGAAFGFSRRLRSRVRQAAA